MIIRCKPFDNMGENAIQGMKEFKTTYFYKDTNVPEQSILIFDESQRAWDAEKLGRGFTEPEGLFRVGERIYENRDYAVLIGLYGNDQVTISQKLSRKNIAFTSIL